MATRLMSQLAENVDFAFDLVWGSWALASSPWPWALSPIVTTMHSTVVASNVRGRFHFETLKRKVIEIKERYGDSTLLIEDSPISRGLIQSLKEQSVNVVLSRPTTDKRARVIAQTDLFAGGSIRLPHAANGLKNSWRSCRHFPVATTIRLTRSPRVWPGGARRGEEG